MVTKDKGLTYNSTLHAIKVLACFSVVAIHIIFQRIELKKYLD